MEALVESTLGRWFTEPFRHSHEYVMARLAQMIRSTPVAGYVGCCHAIPKIDVTDRLKDIKCPTIVIVGDHRAKLRQVRPDPLRAAGNCDRGPARPHTHMAALVAAIVSPSGTSRPRSPAATAASACPSHTAPCSSLPPSAATSPRGFRR